MLELAHFLPQTYEQAQTVGEFLGMALVAALFVRW